MELKDKIKKGIEEAICTRGKRKGMLKAKCPKMDTYGAAVWQGLMTYSNPHKVGFGHLIFMTKECREIYNYIIEVGKVVDLSTFDTDGNILRSLNLIK